MKYERICAIDNYQELLWQEVEEIGANIEALLLFLLTNRTGISNEVLTTIPLCDEVLHDDGKHIITYTDGGMCETISLYEVI